MKEDINDTLRDEGPDAVRKRHDKARKYEPGANSKTEWIEQAPDGLPPSAGNDEELKAAANVPLPYVDLALDPIPPREWLVPERIPMRNVAMLGGEGAIGKSLLLMQLSGAVVLGGEWIGTLPKQGPVLYMSCEEE